MHKKIVVAALFTLTVGMLFYFFLNSSADRVEVIEEKPLAVRNDLPDIPITTLSGAKTSTRALNQGKVILVFFQPDCDHCQREAAEISKHIAKFNEFTFYFISSASLPSLEKFSREYNFAGNPAIHFATTPANNVLKTLGPIDTPSLYIYNNGQIVKAFNGETPIDNILQFI